MKTLQYIISLFLLSLIFFNVSFGMENPQAVIEWKQTEIDFGKVPFNEPIEVEFTFKNPGMIPLVISEVKPSCGCTVANYPKQPIGSGGEGAIKVTFDAKTPGYFSKTISVYSNSADGVTELYIKGKVVKN